jgi:hypothetical protein
MADAPPHVKNRGQERFHVSQRPPGTPQKPVRV